ncbi:hypothetical protein TcasGA2_TC033526 [Tribolium castaneum]|uniref:Uncharacterized protein n=1 Tax=Tribolium castaneum TaxID=7070 RepID=A0A139WFW2_TRICA|nr:hypothetical protein TcasGA2_TC033526 [Tribolium castaneum]
MTVFTRHLTLLVFYIFTAKLKCGYSYNQNASKFD